MQNLDKLTIKQARKLALVAQQLPNSGFARGLKGTLEAIKHLGYVQIDTISVVERAHHHTLWNRVPHYRHRYVDKLIEQREIFEYWSHAAAYLPIEDFRFCLPRMHAIKSGQRHWYQKNTKLMNYVRERIKIDGPLQAKDFEEHQGYTGAMWEWGPIKQAIENLFMQGDLLITRRDNFQKVFDLTERILPPNINTASPSKNDFAHFLITRHLDAHAIGHITEFGYLRKGMGTAIKKAVQEQLEEKKIKPIKIQRRPEVFYVKSNFETLLDRRLVASKVKVLSPFDNLVIQRKRILRLFDFDYQLECYVPEKKRNHGYFVLPIVWQGDLTARLDAKADRKKGEFIIKSLILETNLKQHEKFGHYLAKELQNFAEFNRCPNIKLGSKVKQSVKNLLELNQQI